MPNFKTTVKVIIRNKHGKIVKHIRKNCHSYIRQMIDFLYIQMAQATIYVKMTDGDTWSVAPSAYAFRVTAGATVDTYGIQVGTGTDAVTINDYKLKTPILHGDTSTKLNYGAVSVGAVAIVGSVAKFTISRTFTNNSGADITVEEVGLIMLIDKPFLFEKSLLNFTIADGASGTVTYTISVTV